MSEQQILCVGLVCLDIINVVDKYPEEDSDTRCVSQRWQRGGNASNSSTVLSLLGVSTSFMGAVSSGPVADFLLGDLRRYGVEAGSVLVQSAGQTPCACCLVCPSSGSRTVVLYDTNLPDVDAHHFSTVDLHRFTWIHWEGRNAEEQLKMIQRVRTHNSSLPRERRITVSVEIEKTRETLFQLFPHGDVVFVSKDVARHFGFDSSGDAVRGLYPRLRDGAVLVCPWAETGASALGPDGVLLHSEAFPPETLVDTLGAGDTFNAAVIYTLSNGGTLQDALTFGCRVAGWKCGFHGYDGIRDKLRE